MIEFYLERKRSTDDLLSFNHLRSICQWENKFQELLQLNSTKSLSLATFVALYSGKTTCQSITKTDVKRFRSILQTCLPYYVNGYMDIPLSDTFLNRVVLEHHPGHLSHQEQIKAVYTALRHTCFYKNITRFIFDHFLDKNFLVDLQDPKTSSSARVSLSMIYISNYRTVEINRTRDQLMCLRRQPYAEKYCRERGCMNDHQISYVAKGCAGQGPPNGTCENYCACKFQCVEQFENVLLMIPIYKGQELVNIFEKFFAGKRQLATYQDEFVRLVALNLANVRERAAMARISEGKMTMTRQNPLSMSPFFRHVISINCNSFDYWHYCSLFT